MFDVGKKTRMGTYFLYQNEPNHAEEADSEMTLFTVVTHNY
jgi:hypothetical protein